MSRRRSLARRWILAAPALLAADVAFAQTTPIRSMFSTMSNKTITGVTVITHGYQPTDTGGDSLMSIATSIRSQVAQQTGGNAWLLDYDVPQDLQLGRFDLSGGFNPPAGAAAGHVVFLFDWAAESNRTTGRFADSAGDALFALMNGLRLVDSRNARSSPPLHMIAHSFGSGVTSEAVERMARYNVPVANLTYIDPHDFDQAGVPVDENQQIFTMGRPNGYGATVWNNVAFADTYYQTRGTQAAILNPVTNNPEGRPVAGAHNRHLSTELPAGNPYSNFTGDSDHSYAWHTFYRATIEGQRPAGTHAPQTEPDYSTTGWAFSVHNQNRTDLANGPRNFYAVGQNHEHSETTIVNRTTGLPNTAGLTAQGLTANDITNGRFAPVWPKTEIANGNFAGAGSNTLISGWTHHGGGGTGFLASETNPTNFFLRLNFGDDTRTHNFAYVPINAKKLQFEKRVVDGSSDDLMSVNMGDAADGGAFLGLIDVTTAHGWQTTSYDVPAVFRGRSTTFDFQIVSPTVGSIVDSEIDLDSFVWVLLNPILGGTPAGSIIDFGGLDPGQQRTINSALTMENIGEAESVIDVQSLEINTATPRFSSPNFAYAALTAGGPMPSKSCDLKFGGAADVGVYSEILRIGTSEGFVNYTARAVVQPGNRWGINNGGQWSNAGNWLGPVPDATGAVANFFTVIQQPETITAVNEIRVGQIYFADVNRYTLAGETITIGNAAGNAGTIGLLLGDHSITAPLFLECDTTVVGPGRLTASHVENDHELTVRTRMDADNITGLGDLSAEADSVVIANEIKMQRVRIVDGGVVSFNPRRAVAGRWGTLDMNPVNPTGFLDLRDNAIVGDYAAASPIDDYRALVKNGYNNGNWQGFGIVSQDAIANLGSTAIGVVEASSILGGGGGMFLGDPVDGTSVLARYTLYGDANINGTVNIVDFARLAINFNGPGGWGEGDFDYDGFILIFDFARLAANFNQSLAGMRPAAVPEPTTGAAAMLATGALACRRRTRRASLTGRD